jgi:hypothetical protein
MQRYAANDARQLPDIEMKQFAVSKAFAESSLSVV